MISKASRWSVRKSRPIVAGLPNETDALVRQAAARLEPDHDDHLDEQRREAATAPTVCQLGPPAHGASARPPR